MKIKTPIAIVKSVAAAHKQKAYDKMIAESQAKIGPYVHVNDCPQIWA